MKKKNEKHIAILLAVMMIFMNFIIAPVMADGDVAINELNFPDANFLAYVQTRDGDHDGKLSPAEIVNVTVIDVTSKNIASLSGIKYFTALQTLHCGNNQLSTLDMSKNTALQSLYCYSNKLTNLDISQNLALQTLDCSSNQLTSLDISNNPSLKILYCQYNQLTSLDISNNPSLIALYCQYNQLTSLDLSNNLALAVLWCNRNQLTNLNVSKNTALQQLYCNNNQLTSVDISNNPALRELYCYNNQLTNLDVSKNTALQELKCNDNELTKMDVSNNTKLETLYCGRNQLTILDLSKNINLKALYCGVNQLTTLDLSKNINLKTLDCGMNQLTNLDLSSNTALVAFAGLNQKYNIQVNASTLKFNLRSLPGKFNPSNASGWVGGDVDTVDSNILKLKNDPKPTEVKYNYKVNNDDKNINVTLKVKYGNFVTVTFNKNGKGGDPATIVKTIDKGSTVEKPSDPTDEQYDFDGWYTEAECANKFDFLQAVDDNITLYAKWKDKTQNPPAVEQVKIKFLPGEGATGSMTDVKVDKNSEYTLPESTFTAPANKEFKAWQYNNEEKPVGSKITVGETDITLTAIWKDITPNPPAVEQVTVKFLPGEGATGSMEDVKVDKNSEYTLPASTFTPPVNKEFKAWKFGEEEKPVGSKINVGETDITLTAIWKDITPNPPVVEQVTITYDPNGGNWNGDTTVFIQEVDKDQTTAVKEAPTKEGYTFKGWMNSVDQNIYQPGVDYHITETVTFTAQWEQNQPQPTGKVTITYDPSGGNWNGDTNVFKEEVDKDQTTAVKEAPTKEGYTFKGWMNSVDQKTYQPGVDYHITETVTFIAQWEQNQTQPTGKVTITFDPNGGTGEMKPVEVDSNSTYNLPECKFNAPPNKEFDKWSYNTVAVAVGTAIKVEESNITLIAIWKDQTTNPPVVEQVTVTFNKNRHGGEPATTEVTIEKGTTVAKPIDPTDANFDFGGWYKEDECRNPFVFTDIIETDTELYAKWTPKTVTPPTPPTPPTPDPYIPPYTPDYYDYYDYYDYHRPYRPYETYKSDNKEEKTTSAKTEELILKVILTENSKELEKYINAVKSITLMDVAPYIKDGRIMLPIRFVSEALGMNVGWDNETRTVIIQDMFYRVEIPVDTNKIIVNGVTYTSDVMPEIKNDRTMMPIANVARALGLVDGKDIFWDGATRKATIIRKLQNN